MEELKLLVEMVSNLPAMALWVIAFFFGYKVLIVGSIYGVIRFCVQKGYDSIVAWKIKAENKTYEVDRLVITGCFSALMDQLRRVRGKGTNINSDYIHGCSVDWLREAIDEKIAKDEAAKKKAA
jgi:hypothetical protein